MNWQLKEKIKFLKMTLKINYLNILKISDDLNNSFILAQFLKFVSIIIKIFFKNIYFIKFINYM
jgi:hypothetical protein